MKMPNMIVTTLAAIAIITVLGFLARDDGRVGSGEIGLEVGVPLEHRLTNIDVTYLYGGLPCFNAICGNKTNGDQFTAVGPIVIKHPTANQQRHNW